MLGSLQKLPLPAPPEDGDLGQLAASQVTEESDERNLENNEDQKMPNSVPATATVASHAKTIGLTHLPLPPDIGTIVYKTARFVAKNGQEFEKTIIANNDGNEKFNFLCASDPYHTYYQDLLAEARAQNQSSATQPPEQDSAPQSVTGTPVADEFVRKVLEPPEAEQYTLRLPEGINGEELDIIKLTAQFVVRSDKSFLTSLTRKEETNPQFHFLRPTDRMFMFFVSLVDAYIKALIPPRGLTDKLKNRAANLTSVLEPCMHRLAWERKAEDEIDQERLQMAMIDWSDFVVAKTIDFADDEDEDLPPPMTLDEVIRRSKMSAMEDDDYVEPGKELEKEKDEEEVQLVEEGLRSASLEENGNAKNNEGKASSEEQDPPMRIVKNRKRPEDRIPAERDLTEFVVSPITGEFVPIGEVYEHMRISLIDPKYKEQKDRMFAKIKKTTLATDDEIFKFIIGFAITLPDIFGTIEEEEVSNAVKAEIEKKKDEQPKQVIWDGNTRSIGCTANQAMSQNSGVDDMGDASNYDGRGLLGPAPPPPRLGMPPIRPPTMVQYPNTPPLGPAPPPPRLGMPPIRPPPLPPSLALNIPRPPTMVQYPNTPPLGPLVVNAIPAIRPLPPSMPMMHGQPHMANRPPMPSSIPVPLPPGSHSQYTPLGVDRQFVPVPMSQPGMPMPPPPPMPLGMPPPPPPEEAPPPLPEEPDPKRQRLDDSMLIPEDQFLAKHPGTVRVNISVPDTDEGNLKGQVLEIPVQSLSETVGSLKEKIAGEIQLPANKQKLSGKAGFLKDNLSLAYYNVGPGEPLSLSLRERLSLSLRECGGRKR